MAYKDAFYVTNEALHSKKELKNDKYINDVLIIYF